MTKIGQRPKLDTLKYLATAVFILASCLLVFYPLNSNAADYPNKARFFYESGYCCVSNFNEEQPGYCVDFTLNPDKTGEWEYKKVDSSHSLDYLMYHGADGPEFQQHHTILGVDVNDEETAHAITQLSVWASQGVKTGIGLDENFNNNGVPPNYYTSLTKEHQKLCNMMLKNALDYEKKGPNENDPEYKCSRLYKCGNASYQRFVTYYSLGNLKLNKVSSLPDITDENNLYDLENTYFHIYKGITWDEAVDTGKWMKTISQTNIDGKIVAKSVDVKNPNNDFISLKNGTYWLVEEKYEGHTNTGYIKQSDPIKVYIFPKQTSYGSNNGTDYVENNPKYVAPEYLVEKYSTDSMGSSSDKKPLNNVKFEVNYYDTFTKFTNDSFEIPNIEPVRSWILSSDNDGLVKLDDNHKIGGDSLYLDENGNPCIPRGTITIQEIEAPNQYKVDDTIHVVQTDQVNEKPIGVLPIKLSNPTKRSDLSFTKMDATTNEAMSSIPFKMTNIDTNESHILVTNNNGCVNTSSSNIRHSHNTNINDNYVDGNTVTDETKLTCDSGVWFSSGNGNTSEINDYVGALPYGKYKIEELRCSKNVNKNCQPFEVKIEDDSYNYCLTVDNNLIEFNTSLTNEQGDKFITDFEYNILIDKVYLSNLNPNSKYKLVGTLHQLDNDKDLGVIKDSSGKPLTTIKEFETTSDATINTTLKYNVNTAEYIGKQLVSCVELYSDNDLVATHNDIYDLDQTVSIPNISTYASNNNSDKNIKVDKEAKIVDEITYKGLVKNKTYAIIGKIYNTNDTSIPIKCFKNNFIAKSTNGKTSNSTTLDTTKLMGDDLVITEEIYYEDDPIVKHEDFADNKQTVHIPCISTEAKTNSETNCFDRLTTKTIVDTVKYENLIPDKEYKIVASLNNVDNPEIPEDKTTNHPKPLKDIKSDRSVNSNEDSDSDSTIEFDRQIDEDNDLEIKEIQNTEILFTPTETSGEIDIEFEVNERNFNNKIVVFDKLYLNDKLIITHDDINDIDQTIYIPKVHTKLSSIDGSKEIIPSKSSQLIDIVEISNLPINTEYTAVGKLIILDNDGNEIKLPNFIQKRLETSAPIVFENNKAAAELTYEIDTLKIPNHKIISTVEIKLDDKTCVTHYDLNDKNQTVKVLRNEKMPKTFDIFSSRLMIKTLLIAVGGIIVIRAKSLWPSYRNQRHIY